MKKLVILLFVVLITFTGVALTWLRPEPPDPRSEVQKNDPMARPPRNN